MKRGKTETETFSYDASFQERIIRTMFQEPDWCITLCMPHLHPGSFENNVHRWFAETLIGYATKHMSGATLDAVKISADNAYVAGRLVARRDKAQVDALLSKLKKKVPDRTFIKEELFRFIKNQTFKQAVLNGMDLMKQGKLDDLDAEVTRILEVQAAASGGLGHFLVSDAKARYKKRLNYEELGIPTGIECDVYMKGGGPLAKQLAAIVAPPSGGKSSTLINIARQAVELGQQQVLYITLELSEEIIVDRIDSCFTKIAIGDLEAGDNPKKVRRYMKRLGQELGGEPIVVKEFPAQTITVRHIEHYIRQLERRSFYPGVVIVDYADLLLPEAGLTGDSYEDAGNLYVQLRAMAQRLGILVWTAGQGNRQSLGKKIITMKELADSFKKAMHADVLLALCQTDEEKHRNIARYFMMKNRNGRADMEFPVKTDWSRCRVTNR
jgi:replicative DNA helicase